jgi:hypothetical protein
MKVIITENKRKDLAYKLLDNIFNGLTREDIELIPKKGYIKNSGKGYMFSNHRVLFKDRDGESILKWSGHNNGLYVYPDFWLPLTVFSFGEIELERIIFQWFKDRIKIETEEVYLVGFDY